MFSKIKDLYKLQKQAKQLKNELKTTHVEGEADGVTVVVDGQQNPVSIFIAETLAPGVDPHILRKIETAMIKALGKTMKKVQEVAAAKMKSVMGDVDLSALSQQ